MMVLRYLLIPLILIACIGQTYAQPAGYLDEPQFVYKFWNNQNGLPQNTVYDVEQGGQGYLWIATEEGLIRFDGNNFQVHNEANTPGLYSSSFYDITPSPGKGIWAASRNTILKKEGNKITTYDFRKHLSSAWIKCIAEDKQGRLWVGTSAGKLLYIQNDTIHKFRNWKDTGEKNNIQVLYPSGKGLMIGTVKGLFLLAEPGGQAINIFPGANVKALAEDQKDQLWIGTEDSGLYCRADIITHYTEKQGLREGFITALGISNDGSVWVGTRTSGVQVLTNGSFTEFGEKVLSHESIKSISVKQEGLVWIGTTASGLLQARPSEVQMLPKKIPLNSDIILPIYQHQNGDIWVGTAGKGVNRINGGSSQSFSTANGLSNNLVLSLYGAGNYIYIGTANGLDRFNYASGKIDRHYKTTDGLAANFIQAIMQDSRGRVWVATRPGGLHLIDEAQKLQRITIPAGFQNADLVSLFEDRDHNIWVGSSGHGALKIGPGGQQQEFSKAQGMPGEIVECFFQDHKGIIWMGTEKGLVAMYKGSFPLFNKSNGLKFNDIYRIMNDASGFLWMSGNFGLQRISLASLHQALEKANGNSFLSTRLFNTEDGMANAETNGGIFPAGWKMRDGSLWFPTVKGIAIVHPELVNENVSVPNIMIQSLRYGNNEQDLTSRISIPPGVYNIEIDYTSIDFRKSYDLTYYYRLKGLSNNWDRADNRRTAYFTALDPGKYTFEVKALQYGNWSPSATISFEVQPFLYQTLWFRALAILLLLGLITYIVLFQRKMGRMKLMDQKKITQATINGQEKERQIIGSDLHDNINQKLTTAKLYLDFARSNEEMRLSMIEKSEQVVNGAINEIRVISKSLIPPTLKDIGLCDALQELQDSYAVLNQFRVHFKCSDDMEDLDSELKLAVYRIMQEHFNNIVKHAAATNVWIDIELGKHQLLLTMRDDGRGFDVRNRPQGVGLANMRHRLDMFNGKIDIISAPGHGCTIHISIPV